MSKSVDPCLSDCRLVRYGVYHPLHGWHKTEPDSYQQSWQNHPALWDSYVWAKARASNTGSQLVTFDVRPISREWQDKVLPIGPDT